MVTEKSTSFPTPSDETKQNIDVANDDNTGTEIRMAHEDIDANDQMDTKKQKSRKILMTIKFRIPVQQKVKTVIRGDSLFDDDGEALDPKTNGRGK